MGTPLTDDEMTELEKILAKSRIRNPNVFISVFMILLMILVFIILFITVKLIL